MATALQLSYVDGGGVLNVLELDAFLSEHHQHTAKATQFPVETGVVISDHVIQEPDVVRLDVIVSDTPLPAWSSWSGEGIGLTTVRGRAAALYRKVVELKEAALLVSLITTVHTYDSMVVEAVDLPVDFSTGDAARFSVSLRKIIRVGQRTVAVPKIERAGGLVSHGKQPTKAADPVPDSAARAAKKALVGP